MNEESKKKRVKIDGQAVEVLQKGHLFLRLQGNLVGAFRSVMCYYSKLKDSGGRCRTCLVEVSKISNNDARPMPKLVASCKTEVMDEIGK